MIAITLFLALSVPVFYAHMVSAAGLQLQSRQLKISSSANGTITQDIGGNVVAAGSGGNGQKTKETFTFTLPTHTPANTTVGSILIEFCDDPIPVDNSCSMTGIAGFNAANVASIVTQTGFSASNSADPFTLDASTVLTGAPWACSGSSPGRTNCIAMKRTTGDAESDGETITLAFGGATGDYITNPTADNTPFYARIQLYSDTAYTTKQDYGTVVGSTAQQIDITAKVKEVLNFSVGNATSLVAPTGLCTPLTTNSTTGAIALGDSNGVLSFQQAYDSHSYFRLSTNTNGGVNVFYSGDTLKNGSNQINPAGSGSPPTLASVSSTTNSSQFGLAIDSSDTQAGNGYSFTSLHAIDNATYASPSGTDYSNGAGTITTAGTAKFAFNTASKTVPEVIATATGAVACDTGSVRYLGNISTATPAGIYTTTITYIATGTY